MAKLDLTGDPQATLVSSAESQVCLELRRLCGIQVLQLGKLIITTCPGNSGKDLGTEILRKW